MIRNILSFLEWLALAVLALYLMAWINYEWGTLVIEAGRFTERLLVR